MISEKQKMLSGANFSPTDPELVEERQIAHEKCYEFNATSGCKGNKWERLAQIFGVYGENCYIEPPFFCDYGYNIELGKNVYLNCNCVILDCLTVKIGDFTKIGPNVHFYTVEHPLNPIERKLGYELAKPIIIGENVWIGGGAIILSGVEIGDNSVIGAGSVVTKNLPNNVIAVGNPCKIIRVNH